MSSEISGSNTPLALTSKVDFASEPSQVTDLTLQTVKCLPNMPPHTHPCSLILPTLVSAVTEALLVSECHPPAPDPPTSGSLPLVHLLLDVSTGLPEHMHTYLVACDPIPELPELAAARQLQLVSGFRSYPCGKTRVSRVYIYTCVYMCIYRYHEFTLHVCCSKLCAEGRRPSHNHTLMS